MSLIDRLTDLLLRVGTRGPDRPLAEWERRYFWTLPFSVLLSLVSTLLEGVSIGLLVPMLGVLMSEPDQPEPIPFLHFVRDFAVELSPAHPLPAIGILILALMLVKNAIGTVGGLVMTRIEGQASADLHNILAQRLMRLPYSFYLTEEPPRLVNIISSDGWRVPEALQSVYGIASAIASTLVLSVLALLANWKLFSIVILGALIARVLQRRLARKVKSYSDDVSAANRVLGEQMMLTVDLARLTRIFNQEDHEQERFNRASEGVRAAVFAVERASALYSPILEMLLSTLFILVLIIADGMHMSLPEILAFMVLQYRLQPHVMAVNQGMIDLAALSGSIKEVEWLLGPDDKPAQQSGGPIEASFAGPIRFENVTYTYPYDPAPVIRDASFAILPGQATALIGPSGAGKSTLINLLLRLMDPDSGQILLGERALNDIDPSGWRSRIALAGQDVDLVEGTIAENIAYRHPGVTAEDIEQAARIADAHDFIMAIPGGYQARVSSYGSNFSGGQRQRISLARALVRRPELLILDEATNAVDGISERAIIQLLSEHRRFGTAVVISHRRSTLQACEQGIVIGGGRIIEAGPLRSLDFYREMERQPEVSAALHRGNAC